MKKIALVTVLSLAATSAFAGGLAEPIVEPAVIEATTASSAPGIVVPLLLLAIVAAAAAS